MADALDQMAGQKTGIDLGTILRVLRKRKWMILGITIAVAVLVGMAASKQPRIYQATATIVIEIAVPQYLGSGFRDVVEIEPSWWSSRENLETEFRVLRSESQAVAVSRAMCGRTNDAAAKAALSYLGEGACADTAAISKTAARIRRILTVAPVKDSRIVHLTVQSESPQFAAYLANLNASVYLDKNLERRLSQSQHATTWLENQHGGLETQLNQAEQSLVDF